MVMPCAVSAAMPYTTYTYGNRGQTLISPAAYVPDMVKTPAEMGIPGGLEDASDIFVAPDQKLYIVDRQGAKVVVLDRYYNYLYTIDKFINDEGVPDSFALPSGVYVNEEHIYVCDTNNARIVMFDTEGNFYKIIDEPVSNLFDEGSIYRPVACVADDYGRVFVVSSSTYQGVIVLNTEGDFFGFIGAQKVTITALEIFWRTFQTKEQRAMTKQYVSTEFNNIFRDEDNFIYVTTTSIDLENALSATTKGAGGDYAPVKKINASGKDVMKRNGIYPPHGEINTFDASAAEEDEESTTQTELEKLSKVSKIVGGAIGPSGSWSILDRSRSRVFTYDEQGELLFAFGDEQGAQIGNISEAVEIVYCGTDIVVLEGADNSIVVFRRTEYCDLLFSAIEHDLERKYDLMIDDWREILKRNNNFITAYKQIGRSLYRQGNYEEAMEYFVMAKEEQEYSTAYAEIRKEWANKYFWIIPIIIVVAFVLLAKVMGAVSKVNKRTALKIGRKSLKEELFYALYVILHPFDGFWDLKHEKRGSVRSATVILGITVAVMYYDQIGQSYMYNPSAFNSTFSLMTAAGSIIVPLLLWVVANWCLTTLFEGEGSMKDIYVATCYALTPIALLTLPKTLLTNVLTLDEAGLITLIATLSFVWTGLLIFLGMMVTHDYSIGKNILTCIVTIVGIAFIIFLALLFTSLISKMWIFLMNIYYEIYYRLQ